MATALQPITDFVVEHHAWAGLALGIATFLESLVVIGAFVPATALLFLAGGLIAAGVLDPVVVLLWSVGGATVGDAVSFMLGRRLGARALHCPFFRVHRRTIARTRLLSRRYGVAWIYIGRFLGPLRAFVPVMAGMLQMKTVKFQIANALSAVVWAAVLLTPGYLAARGLTMLDVNGAWALGVAAVLAVGALCRALWKMLDARGQCAAVRARALALAP